MASENPTGKSEVTFDPTPGTVYPRAGTAPGPGGAARLAGLDDTLPFVIDLQQRYGDVVYLESDVGRSFLVTRPDLVEYVFHKPNFDRNSALRLVLGDGVLSSSGDYWRQQRALMQHRFKIKNLLPFAALITGYTSSMLEHWQSIADSGVDLDIYMEMRKLTLKIIAHAFFSLRLEDDVDEICEAINAGSECIGKFTAVGFNYKMPLDPGFNQMFVAAVKVLDRFAYDIIAQRRRQNDKPDDLLTLLIESSPGENGGRLTDRQIRDEVVTLLLAGHETTASVMTWIWYLLTLHPECKERLLVELDEKLGGRPPGVEDLDGLEYTRMVIQESMRLYPPVWLQSRTAIQDDEVGSYHIPANSNILLSSYVTHHRPDLWPDPDGFVPERFHAGSARKRARYAYFPFGGGRHKCPGEPLAMMEMPMILAAIHQRFDLRLGSDQTVPVTATTLRPKERILMSVVARRS